MAAAILTSSASLDGLLGLDLDAQLLAHHGERVGRDHGLHEVVAAGRGDGVTQVRGPVVLDDQDGRGAAGGDGRAELVEAVDRQAGVALGHHLGAQLRSREATLQATLVETDEGAGDGAQAHPLGLREVGHVHRVLDAAVGVLLDEEDVDDTDDAALPHPAQLGHDAAGGLEPVEADDEDLDGTGDVLVAHLRSPVCCGWLLGSAARAVVVAPGSTWSR